MRFPIALSLISILAACVSNPSAPPPVPPSPPPAPKPLPTPPRPTDWQDWPMTPGDWAWRQDARGSVALFGPAGGDALFIARCDKAAGAVFLSLQGALPTASSARMTVRATAALKDYPAAFNGDTPPYASARLGPRDPQLDAVAFSRGRFVVSVTGLADLVIPSWPEFARVVEDCRG